MATILLATLESVDRGKANFKLIQDINESGACMKFEQNPLKM